MLLSPIFSLATIDPVTVMNSVAVIFPISLLPRTLSFTDVTVPETVRGPPTASSTPAERLSVSFTRVDPVVEMTTGSVPAYAVRSVENVTSPERTIVL